jgi:hypothetical protein
MSDDIVGRLRAVEHYECSDCWYSCPNSKDGCCDDTVKRCICNAPLIWEAADEIETLQKMVVVDGMVKVALNNEVERLRASGDAHVFVSDDNGGTVKILGDPDAVAAVEELKLLTDDLADVLARMVIGWEDRLGVDLAQHPDVQRVMARYRRSVGRE